MREFPIQRYGMIPWSLAQRAYSVYASRYGTSQTLERLAERGGFGVEEMDAFVPGWEAHVTDLATLRARCAEQEAVLRELEWSDHNEWGDPVCPVCGGFSAVHEIRPDVERGHDRDCRLSAAINPKETNDAD